MRGLLAAMLIATGCTQGVPKEQAVTAACVAPESVADYVHMVIEADRATYSDRVVHRLQNVEKVINASESFEEDHALPLPSQMLRMGAARSAESSGGASANAATRATASARIRRRSRAGAASRTQRWDP